ncbi:hypothetical protein DBR42_06450 [Pelomonas sp. HMWF004]|nr:hypothetical protein DBR42_06450 [Pelomonas sp. HMWF004]
MKISKIIFAGSLPYFSMLVIGAGAFYAGYIYCAGTITPQSKIVYAEKAAIVYGQMMKLDQVSDEVIDAKVRKPMIDVLKKYQREGYTVIDTSKDEQGNMSIMTLPPEARDITGELKAALAKANGQTVEDSKPAKKVGE